MTNFKPRRFLSNGHLQTIVGNFLPRTDRLPAPSAAFIDVPLPPEMQQANLHGAGFTSRILCHCHWQPIADREHAPTVVLVHGLEGSSHSQYIIGNANKLWAAGCNIVRMNMRNCGWTDALSATLYHSGLSCDVLAVLHWLIEHRFTSITLAGYSMGGNLVLKAAGELLYPAPPQLKSVVAVSPPVDLGPSADALGSRSNRVYERRFLRSLKTRYRRKRSLFPSAFPKLDLDQVRSIRDFDQIVMTPLCGFIDADDYYERAGAYRVLDRIAVPTLILHALDDPFIRLTASTRESIRKNQNITLFEPEHGGHCAFLAPPDTQTGYDGYWAELLLRQFVLDHAAGHAAAHAVQPGEVRA